MDAAVRESGETVTALGEPGLVAAALHLARPGLLALVTLSGLAGMVLGSRGAPDARTALVCTIALMLAVAGSVMLNSVFDKPFDLRMMRLRARTRALDRLGHKRAVRLALFLIVAGSGVAFRFLPPLPGILMLSAAFWYLVPYTLRLKRHSPFAAVVGGIPGALPVLIGYSAVDGAIGPDGLILFFLVLLWQPPHFWTLALHCREEYAVAQVPVLPAVKGDAFTIASIFLFAAPLLPASLSLWHFGYCSGWYGRCAALLWAFLLAFWYLDIVKGRRFERAFRSSILYLTALLLAVIVDVCVM